MKKVMYGTLFLALVGIAIVSCDKEDFTSKNLDKVSVAKNGNDIPTFNSREDFKNHIARLNEMSEDQRRNFEKSQEFKSLLTSVYEVYEGVDMESIASQVELEDYISKNSSYVCLRANSNRELEYNAFYADNEYSIVANTDRMFSIGDVYYKVFDDGIATAHKNNLNQLIEIDEIFAKDLLKSDQISISLYTTEIVGDRAACNIVNNVNEEDNGKNRTTIKVRSGSDNDGGYTTLWTEAFIRPYKKTLGIYYYAQRTTNGNIDYTASYYNNTNKTLSRNNVSLSPLLTYKRSDPKQYSESIYGGATQPHFDDIDSWGDTPDTSPSEIDCN